MNEFKIHKVKPARISKECSDTAAAAVAFDAPTIGKAQAALDRIKRDEQENK